MTEAIESKKVTALPRKKSGASVTFQIPTEEPNYQYNQCKQCTRHECLHQAQKKIINK